MAIAMVDLLTPAEAAEKLGVTEMRVRQFCQDGRLGSKFSGRWVITPEELRQFAKIRRKRGRPKNSENSDD